MPTNTDRYLVVGNPVTHSRSPQIHHAFARQFDESIEYERAEIEMGGFADFVAEFESSGGCGLNVTVPFKVDAFEYVRERDDLAQTAGAVNTILFSPGQPSRGFNTDGVGLLNDLTRRHHVVLEDKAVLVLGAGGASHGVLQPIMQARPSSLVIANRTVAKAQALVAEHQAGTSASGSVRLQATGLGQIKEKPDVIINATSSGLSGGAEMIDAALVEDSFCYDMSYGAAALFRDWAARHGAARSVDGLGMLVEQAAQSYYLWRGKRPETESVMAMLRSNLAEQG
jgi:shikimate dehydrogenase